MRLAFVTDQSIPDSNVDAYLAWRMAAAFAAHGVEVSLIHALPEPSSAWSKVDPAAHYGTSEAVTPIPIRVANLSSRLPGSINETTRGVARTGMRLLRAWSFALGARRAIVKTRPDIVYTTTLLAPSVTRVITRHRPTLCYEAYRLFRPKYQRLKWGVVRHLDRVVVLSETLRETYLAHGIPGERVLSAHPASDVRPGTGASRLEMRRRLGIAPDVPVVCYSGSADPFKGVDVLVQAARKFESAILTVVVGGTDAELRTVRSAAQNLPNVRIVGHVSPAESWQYLAAADIAVAPYRGEVARDVKFQGPMKLFEYMAANCAIVASDLPHIREILADGESAVLVPPDRPDAVASAINQLVHDRPLGEKLARNAARAVRDNTWENRASLILRFLAISERA